MLSDKRIVIERVVANVVEMDIGFQYSTMKLNKGRAIIWEVYSAENVGWGENRLRGHSIKAATSLKSRVKSVARKCLSSIIDPEYNLAKSLSPMVKALLGKDARYLDNNLHPLPNGHGAYFERWVREGLGIALYDLVGKHTGKSVCELLGGLRRRLLPGMPVIHIAEPEVMAEWANAWVADGYRFLKVKISGSLDRDAESLRTIRQAVGKEVPIQVDCNSGYKNLEEAQKAVLVLREYLVESYEDMFAGSLENIALLRKRTGARIMVDGPSYWPNVLNVIEKRAADIINHHPNNQGGMGAALMINAAATASGVDTSIGSSGLFGIQNAAFQMLAGVMGINRPCEDIGLIPYYSGPTRGAYNFEQEPSVVKRPYAISNGVITIPDAPGLGIELDPDRLAKVRKDSCEFTL